MRAAATWVAIAILCACGCSAKSRTDPGATDAASVGDGGPDGSPPAGDDAGAEQPDAAPEEPARGAAVPWDEYEAEDAQNTGTLIGPSRAFGEIATESSGRRAVRLDETGQYVEITAERAANSIVLRYVIPDAPAGGGIDATLSLYVDGAFRQRLPLTSRFAWTYGGEADSTSNDPSLGGAHHFYDEVGALVGDIAAGATVRLQRDAADTADYYVIDLIDLELVAPPLSEPAGALSIADCGATADDGSDDHAAIQSCIDQARSLGESVWIPAGTFHSLSGELSVAEVEIRGAGMWYSRIRGPHASFRCTGNGCRYRDFAVFGETVSRDDATPDNAFNGAAGTGSALERIWVEHTKVGWWVGSGATDGLVVRENRFRDLFADGVNLCNGASNSIVEQNHARNTGDDAFASWSPSFDGGVNHDNVFRFNTVQVPWRANCYAIYGGRDNRIEDSICFDVVTYPGVLIAQQFTSHPFAGTTAIRRTSLIRAGGPMWGQEHGALKLHASEGPVTGVVVEELAIEESTFAGITIQGPGSVDDVALSEIEIDAPGTWGLQVTADASGAATATSVAVTGAGAGGLDNQSASFSLIRGPGNSGW